MAFMSKLEEVGKDKSSFHKPRIWTMPEEDFDSQFNDLRDHFKYDFKIDYSSFDDKYYESKVLQRAVCQ